MGKRILVVDDEDSFRFAASLSLRQAGYEVSEAGRAKDAFGMIMESQRSGLPYDLIMLDINMPDFNGTELFDDLRQCGITTPVVFITGYANEKALCKAYRQAKSQLLQKPFASEEMLHLVGSMVSGK